jgi:methyl-accepting chemotaxis protein
MARDTLAQADAIGKSQAVIEFDMDGTIVVANENFRRAGGVARGE